MKWMLRKDMTHENTYRDDIRLGLFLLLKTNLLEENTVNTLFSFNALQNIINKCSLLTLKVVVKFTILFYPSLLFMIRGESKCDS